MKRMLAIALMLALTGCIDVPAMNGLMDRLLPEPEVVYREVEVNRFEGQFAPDPNQDAGAVMDAIPKIFNNPNQIGAVMQNLSWVEYTHHFLLPPGATKLSVNITVDYTLFGDGQPNEGPAGTLDLTFHNPGGEQRCRDERVPPCFEIIYFNDKGEKEVDGYEAQPGPVPGEWTITISGSGMEGGAGVVYSGTYTLVVMAELPGS